MIPDCHTVMLPALRLAARDESRGGDAFDFLAGEFLPIPEDRAQMQPGGRITRMRTRVHQARPGWLRQAASR